MVNTRIGPIAALGIALLVGAATAACGSDGNDSKSSDDKAAPPAAWASFGHDDANTRAAADEHEVGPDNVAKLAPAWQLTGVKGVTGTPIVDDGVVYVGDWTGHVRALDAATGEQRWDHDLDSYYVGGSVALDDDHVFVGQFDGHIVALDRATGEQAWDAGLDDNPSAAVFGSPIVADGLVLAGIASGQEVIPGSELSVRGKVVAVDAKTGKVRWTYLTAAEGEDDLPGITVWSSPTVDLDNGLVFVPTGNSYGPRPSKHGDALIALDLKTGKQRWVTQFTAGDTWTIDHMDQPDADVSTPPNLFEVGDTPAVGAGDKAGKYQALDRKTGKVLWTAKLSKGGLQGGVMASAAVADDTIYVAGNNNGGDADLIALDQQTGEERWRTKVGFFMAGPVSWANGVVYLAHDGGKIAGYNAKTGKLLWEHEVAAKAAGGVAIVDGTVYAGYGWWLLSSGDDPQGGMIAFRLGGKAVPVGGGGDGDEGASGKEIYSQRCANCHGEDGQGASGPSMEGVADRLTRDEHIEIVTDGRNGKMPAWGDNLTKEEIEAVVDYERDVLSSGD